MTIVHQLERNFIKLCAIAPGPRSPGRDLRPHARWLATGPGRRRSLRWSVLALLLGSLAAAPARANEPAGSEIESEAGIDGTYLALGPVAAAVHLDDAWDGVFGGEITVVRIRERCVPSALGVTAGAAGYSERSGGRVWADILLAAGVGGVDLGVGAGPVVELDEVRTPRWGGHTSVWVFAGVVPYLRVGFLDRTGGFVEAGLRVSLPAVQL